MGSFGRAIAFILPGALLAGQMNHVVAGPLPTNVTAMKSISERLDTPVDWYGGWGWGPGAGLFAGAIIGGAIASSAYGYYGWYGWPYYYGYPYRRYGYQYYPRAYSYSSSPYYGYGPHCGYYGHHHRQHRCYDNYW
jgi:hypothetical protein